MKDTWASGAIELLEHADSHLQLDSAFDHRIAFISIDNSVETSIRIFLSLPKSKSGITFPRAEVKDAEKSFPKMVDVLFKYAEEKLSGLDSADIEFFHRLRNQFYHNGTGLSVDKKQLNAYRQIAAILLKDLFEVEYSVQSQRIEDTLGNLIILWNQVETLLKSKMEKHSIDTRHTYKWEMLMEQGLLDIEDVKALSELRIIRNTQVHSTADKIDQQRIELGINIANSLLKKLQS